jgi:hypothetical protein
MLDPPMEWRRHAGELFRHDEWNIGVVEAPISAFLAPGFRPEIRWLPVERGTYVADPFGDGGGNIWCEQWRARTGRGRLVRMDAHGQRWPQAGFPEGVHLSYPYMVVDGGVRYCVPECWPCGEVRLYRDEGGERWEDAGVLVPGVAGVDPTLFRHAGRWWMALADQYDEPESALYLWHAPALTGPWRPHRLNPVKRDLASARSAGTPFDHEGVLYRPAQDCSRCYGGAVVINRVERLTPDEFSERTVVRLDPRPEWRWRAGWHTLSAAGERRTLMDARRAAFLPREFGRVLRRKLRAAVSRR